MYYIVYTPCARVFTNYYGLYKQRLVIFFRIDIWSVHFYCLSFRVC